MADQYNALTEVIKSVAAEESAAGNIMKSEAIKLKTAIANNATPEQLKAINDSIGRMVDQLTKNNEELTKKLDIAVNTPADPNDAPTAADKDERKKALNDAIQSIADEENGMADLMNAEAEKIVKVVTNPASTIQNMIDINDSGTKLMEKITAINTALVKKLETSVKAP